MMAEEIRMITNYYGTDNRGNSLKEKKNEEKKMEVASEETCRCKEASNMTPRQLLGLMISDLAFWKKIKKS